MDERELIQRITREVLQQLKASGFTEEIPTVERSSRKPLVILNQALLAHPRVRGELAACLSHCPDVRIFGEKGVGPIPGLTLQSKLVAPESEEEMEVILRETTQVIIPWMPMPVLSRLVHLEAECFTSLLLTKALLKGVNVRARKIFIQPELDLYRSHEPSPILRRVQGLVREGQQMGIAWMGKASNAELFSVLPEPQNPGKKRLLTAADVRALRETGEILLPKGTIVTPLARDEAKKYGLRIRMD